MMKAFALVSPGNFGWTEIPDDPPPGPDEVVVRPTACGICASDVHYWLHGRIGTQVIENYPFVLGHECAGVVVELGEGVTNVTVGQRVAVEPAIPCGRCAPCTEGRQNICPNVRFLATPPYHGALRQSILIPAGNVEPIPESVSFETAALCEPFGVGIHAARLADVSPDETVAIFGAGAIGLSTAMAARIRGAARIILVEPIKERRSLAEAMGFETIPIDPDPVERIRQMTDGGVHTAFEAAGDLRAMSWVTAAPRLGGKSVIIGIPTEDTVPLDIHRVRRAELTIYNSRRSNRTLPEALHLLDGPAADIARMCTHRFPVSEAGRAFGTVSRREDGVVRAMLMFD